MFIFPSSKVAVWKDNRYNLINIFLNAQNTMNEYLLHGCREKKLYLICSQTDIRLYITKNETLSKLKGLQIIVGLLAMELKAENKNSEVMDLFCSWKQQIIHIDNIQKIKRDVSNYQRILARLLAWNKNNYVLFFHL